MCLAIDWLQDVVTGFMVQDVVWLLTGYRVHDVFWLLSGYSMQDVMSGFCLVTWCRLLCLGIDWLQGAGECRQSCV